MPQLQSDRFGRFIHRNLLIGLVTFSIGLFKKTVIADTLAPSVNGLFAAGSRHELGITSAWLAAISFSVQIYFDFSGYSDMAIGVSRMFGLKIPLNFHSPFRASNIGDYWRRWHMTLQRFVVTYIFQPLSIPLNRLAANAGLGGWSSFLLATGLPIFITFVVLGVWHGAGWTFAIFGAMHGLYLAANEAWREHQKRVRRKLRKAGASVADPGRLQIGLYHALTILAVLFANVMFRAPNVGTATSIWSSMTGFCWPCHDAAPAVDVSFTAVLVIALALIFFFPNTQQIMGRFEPASNWLAWKEIGPAPIAWTWKPSFWGLLVSAGGASLFAGIIFCTERTSSFSLLQLS